MKRFVVLSVLLCVFCVALAGIPSDRPRGTRVFRHGSDRVGSTPDPFPSYTIKWFTQTLDHFNFGDSRTYQERYVVVDQYWDGTGPIFFYTGNEGDIVWFMKNTGFVFDIAPSFRPLIIFAEHRYYGESMPFGSQSFDLDKVGYLTSEQVLADYAVLITALKAQYNIPNTPVIAFGGSYGGMLAGWFRLKYPNIVDGAIAASAPIVCGIDSLQYTFNQIVTADFTAAGCADQIRATFAMIAEQAKTSGGLSRLSQQFSLCNVLQSADDLSTFYGWIENALTSTAMVDYPYATNFLKPLPAWPVRAMCTQFAQAGADLYGGMLGALQLWYNASGDVHTCFNITDDSEGEVGDLAWDYQSCTEMILPIASNNVTDFFPPAPFDRTQFTSYCQKKWKVTPRYDWVTAYYGGSNVGYGTNIFWSQGQLDPWRGLGLVTAPSPQQQADVIADGAHHLDLRFANPADPQSVLDARAMEIAAIKSWINQAKPHHRA